MMTECDQIVVKFSRLRLRNKILIQIKHVKIFIRKTLKEFGHGEKGGTINFPWNGSRDH